MIGGKKNKLKQFMAIKRALQKILGGILQTYKKDKHTHEDTRNNISIVKQMRSRKTSNTARLQSMK